MPILSARRIHAILASLALALGAVPLGADDGPHVVWRGTEARVVWYRQGRAEETPLPPPWRLQVDGLPAQLLDPRPPEPGPAAWPAPARMAAVSDPHGHLEALAALLQAQGIVDGRRRWAFGDGHLVVLGDVFDKGTQVTELLWFLRALEAQARAAGGRLHLVLGNHDLKALRGGGRHTDPKYRELGRPLDRVYGPDTELGRWLRTCPVLLRLGDTLFAHAGPNPALLDRERDLEACNRRVREGLGRASRDPLLGEGGPAHYAGLLPVGVAPEGDAAGPEVEAVLAAFQVRRVVVGHVSLARITAFHQGRVVAIDAGLQDGRPGEVWLDLDGRRWRGGADGNREALP
jgi:hypothetical protein